MPRLLLSSAAVILFVSWKVLPHIQTYRQPSAFVVVVVAFVVYREIFICGVKVQCFC